MALDPPYSMGIYETIVNVHFQTGLAVEFYSGEASYITLPQLPEDISKAIMALWFRAPKTTLDAAYNNWVRPTNASETPNDNPHPLFNGITPIVIFGDNTVKGYKIDADEVVDQTVASEIWTQNMDGSWHVRDDSTPGFASTGHQTYEPGDDIQLEPSFIGIDSNRGEIEAYNPEDGGPPPTPNVLVVKLQMTTKANATGMVPIKSSSSLSSDQIFYQQQVGDSSGASRGGGTIGTFGPDYQGFFTSGIDGYSPFTLESTYTDKTPIYTESVTESFTVKLDNHEVKPDHWHVLVFSLDISGRVSAVGYQLPNALANTHPEDFPDHGSISSTCKAWIAFDDVNYKGADIRDKLVFNDYANERLTFAPNAIYTPNAIQAALTRTPGNGSLEIAGNGIYNIRTDSGYSLPRYTYDPGAIRTTAFPLGVPVIEGFVARGADIELGEFQLWLDQTLDTSKVASRRLFVDSSGKPAKPAVATKVLGEPDIRLHGSKNWIEGKNTGTGGSFDPTGLIIKYKPDPSLKGPQSPDDLKK